MSRPTPEHPDENHPIDSNADLDHANDHDAHELPEVLQDEGVQKACYTLSKNSNHRLDKYLQNRIKGFSRHQIQRLISLGGVTVNDKTPKASTKLRKGDVVNVLIPPPPGGRPVARADPA